MDRPPDEGPEGLAENMARSVALQGMKATGQECTGNKKQGGQRLIPISLDWQQ